MSLKPPFATYTSPAQSAIAGSQFAATMEMHKPILPTHNREVVELQTPHIRYPGLQKVYHEEINHRLSK
jgi:hypothetical protein